MSGIALWVSPYLGASSLRSAVLNRAAKVATTSPAGSGPPGLGLALGSGCPRCGEPRLACIACRDTRAGVARDGATSHRRLDVRV